jgi:hypothetical protein
VTNARDAVTGGMGQEKAHYMHKTGMAQERTGYIRDQGKGFKFPIPSSSRVIHVFINLYYHSCISNTCLALVSANAYQALSTENGCFRIPRDTDEEGKDNEQ